MALVPFGKITVTSAGTPVRLTSTQSTPANRVGLQSITVQVLPANTGVIYVGDSTLNVSTGAGILAILPAPASATTGAFASVSFSIPLAPTGLNLADYYVDASTNTQSVIVSGAVQ
jgi:hypothetical protein